jgi:hypothetical protein
MEVERFKHRQLAPTVGPSSRSSAEFEGLSSTRSIYSAAGSASHAFASSPVSNSKQLDNSVTLHKLWSSDELTTICGSWVLALIRRHAASSRIRRPQPASPVRACRALARTNFNQVIESACKSSWRVRIRPGHTPNRSPAVLRKRKKQCLIARFLAKGRKHPPKQAGTWARNSLYWKLAICTEKATNQA